MKNLSKLGLAACLTYLSLIGAVYLKVVPGLETIVFFLSLPAVILDWTLIGFAGCGFKGDPWPAHCDLVSKVTGVFVFSLYAILIYFVFKLIGCGCTRADGLKPRK